MNKAKDENSFVPGRGHHKTPQQCHFESLPEYKITHEKGAVDKMLSHFITAPFLVIPLMLWRAIGVFCQGMLTEHGGQIAALKAIGEAGKILLRIIPAGWCIQKAANRIIEHIIREVTVTVHAECLGMSRHDLLIGRGQIDPQGDTHHVEAEYIRIMGNLDILAVVREVYHRLHVQVLLCIIENLRKDVIGVKNTIGIGLNRGNRRIALRRLKFVEFTRVAVVVVNMAAHDVEHDEVVLGWVNLRQILEQRLVVFIGEVIGVVGPFCMVGSFRYQCDGTVVLAVAALITEPPGLIAGFFGYVDDGSRIKEFLAIILALLRQCPLQDRNRL